MTTTIFFEQSQSATHRHLTALVSVGIHAAVLGLLLLIPLIYTEALPFGPIRDYFVTPPPPTGPAKPPVRVVRIVSVEHRTATAETARFEAPREVPRTIFHIVDEAPPAPPVSETHDGIDGAPPGGETNSQFMRMLRQSLPTPPRPGPKPAEVRTPTRITLVSTLSQANLIYAPSPEYPPLAKLAGIQGSVVLEAIISKDGTVENLHVLSGHPLLIKAAQHSVLEWRYRPTLLNGSPVEVATTITVNFRLH